MKEFAQTAAAAALTALTVLALFLAYCYAAGI